MEKKDKWINNFRDRMKDCSEPLPTDLWEQLEMELNTPKVIPMWRRWQSVAAIAMLVVVSSLTVWFWHSPSVDYLEQQSRELATLSQPDKSTIVTEPITPPEQPLAQISPIASIKKVKKAIAESVTVSNEDVILNKEAEKQIENSSSEKQVVNSVGQEKKQKPVTRSTGRKSTFQYAASHTKTDVNWTIGLSAGNIPYTSSGNQNGYAQLSPKPRSVWPGYANSNGISTRAEEFTQQIVFNNLSEQVTSDIKHRLPVTFGASLRIGLDDKWALETGVTYTMLSSDVRSGGKDYYIEDEQRLHYVGIPLKVNRSIWSNRRFEVYASAGGAVEKCVSGELNTTYTAGNNERKEYENETIKVKPLQWSLSAAAGAQLKLTQQLGIYAEPGVVYYFKDGSDVQTIRKEHPFNFNIQLGVRFTLPK